MSSPSIDLGPAPISTPASEGLNELNPRLGLMGMPREVRNSILDNLIFDPMRPNFEAKTPETKYKNFLAMARVNKQLNAEMKDQLLRSKSLIILTTNGGPKFNTMIADFAIPIICAGFHKAKLVDELCATRIHVRNPHFPDNKVSSATVMLASDLPELARVLRVQSLSLPHANFLLGPVNVKSVPRMNMRIAFRSMPSAYDLSREQQLSLLRLLSGANKIGKIRVHPVIDDVAAAKILPGHKEDFAAGPEVTCNQARELIFLHHFNAARRQDGHDYISICDHALSLADKARKARNLELAHKRNADTASFIEDINDLNPCVLVIPTIRSALMLRYFRAQVAIAEVAVEMDNLSDAQRHLDLFLLFFKDGNIIPKEEYEHAMDLQKNLHR